MIPFDTLNFIIDYEAGLYSHAEIVNGFQYLIDTGMIDKLQGAYGRQAAALIDAGHCSAPERINA